MSCRRVRFSLECELKLLEVLVQNPYLSPSKWHDIANLLSGECDKKFSGRSVRDHTDHVLKLWTKRDRGNLFKSGTEEEYGEKEQLLKELFDLASEFRGKAKKKKCLPSLEGRVARDNATAEYCRGEESTIATKEIFEEVFVVEDGCDVGSETLREVSVSAQFPNSVNTMECGNSTDLRNYAETSNSPSASEPTTHPSSTTIPCPETSALVTPLRIRRGRADHSLKGNPLVPFLVEKQKHNASVEEKKLEIQEREMKLKEEKWKCEKKEKEQRWELEKRERMEKIVLEREMTERKMKIEEGNMRIMAEPSLEFCSYLDIIVFPNKICFRRQTKTKAWTW